MIIVIPLETGKQLESVAQAHQLEIPIPLSSDCDSYLSPEELKQILEALHPLAAQSQSTAHLIAALNQCTQNPRAVKPCSESESAVTKNLSH